MAAMRHGWLDHEQVWAQYAGGQLPAEIGGFDGAPARRHLRDDPQGLAGSVQRPGCGGRGGCRWTIGRRSLAGWRRASRAGRSLPSWGARRRRSPGRSTATADEAATERWPLTRPRGRLGCDRRVSKLAARPELREVVAQRLAQRWSPQQIAGGCGVSIPTMRSGGCLTRRSTDRCSCRPKARSSTS